MRGIGNREPGREIVRAVDDGIRSGKQLFGVGRIDPNRERNRLYVGVEPGRGGRSALGLARSDPALVEQDLPLKIAEIDYVVIDQPKPPDSGRGEILNERRADPAGADHRDVGGKQGLLALASNFPQDNVPRVAIELGVGRKVRPGRPPPRNGALSCLRNG
jgi:hypothetical protein